MAARAEDSKSGIWEAVVATWASALTTSSRLTVPASKRLPDDRRGFLLGLQVLAGHGKLLLKAAEAEIIVAHVAHQGDQDVAAVLHGGLEIGPGGLDVAPGAAENIQFPGGIQAHLE